MTDFKQNNKVHHWSDFYQTPHENTNFFNKKLYENLTYCPLSLSSDSYVVNCYFKLITFSGYGAVISLNKENAQFLIEFSTFVECSTTGSDSMGGVLCILSADFAMNHVCGIKCKSSNSFSFSFVFLPGRTVNSIHHSSVGYCFAQKLYTMCHGYGYVEIQSLNLSHNKADSYSAIGCGSSSTKDKIGSSISYSSFADNNATSQSCIWFDRTSSSVGEYIMSNSNLIRNGK